MKIGSKDHIKVKRLKRALEIPLYQAIGILETLFQVTAQSADDGAIGRYSNSDIAIELEWPGDPDALIAALLESGWLDKAEVGRLTVHDWADHCPDFIKDRLRKRNQKTYDEKSGSVPDADRNSPGNSNADRNSPGNSALTHNNPLQPNQLKPNHRSGSRRNGALKSLNLKNEDLRDTARLLDWFAVKLGRDASEQEQIRLLGAAEAAIESPTARNRVKVFVSIVDNDGPNKLGRESINEDHLASGAKRLREHAHAAPAGGNGHNPTSAALVAKLTLERTTDREN